MSDSQIFPVGAQSQDNSAPTRLSPFTKALLSAGLLLIGFLVVGRTVGYLFDDYRPGGYFLPLSSLTTGFFALGVVIYVALSGKGLASLGIKRPGRIWLATLQGVIAGPLMMLAVVPVMMGASQLGLAPELRLDLMAGPNVHIAFALSMVLMWINAAIGEEILFRGFMMNNFQRALGDGKLAGIAAAFLVAVPFGFLHYFGQGWYGVIMTGSVGFLMGLFFLLTKRNIFTVILAHGVFNSIGFVSIYLGLLNAS